MRQQKLEDKVQALFEEQGFEVTKNGNRIKAENGKKIEISVFSSSKYTEHEVISQVEEAELVFVDEEMVHVQDRLDNEISIIKEESNEEYDLPSYELIGDIAVINELVDMDKQEAVEGILGHHPRTKTILLKKEGLRGEFRVGDYEKLYGDETETVHKEFGCRFKVDPTKVYFSERFSTERNRVVSQIEEDEKVLVMFAGVGPFAIMAARNRNPEKVAAVEKNADAVDYMKDNVELNNVEDTVEVFEGDVNDVIPELGDFDRIFMPLPGTANEFLDIAFENVEKEGFIHYYRFLEDGNWDDLIEEIERGSDRAGRNYEIEDRVVCGHKGPGVDRVCIDIHLT